MLCRVRYRGRPPVPSPGSHCPHTSRGGARHAEGPPLPVHNTPSPAGTTRSTGFCAAWTLVHPYSTTTNQEVHQIRTHICENPSRGRRRRQAAPPNLPAYKRRHERAATSGHIHLHNTTEPSGRHTPTIARSGRPRDTGNPNRPITHTRRSQTLPRNAPHRPQHPATQTQPPQRAPRAKAHPT